MAVLTITHPGAVTAKAAFADFYRLERVPLHRALSLTLGNADLAAEAIDEAMVRAYQRWRRISAYDNPSGWVYRVALNWAISHQRRTSRSVPVAVVHDVTAARGPEPADEDLAKAIAALPTQQRAVVVLRFHLDWSLERIATALDVPTGTVKSRLNRGLATLRTTLGVEL